MARRYRPRLRAQILLTLMALLALSLLAIYFVVRGVQRSALTRQRREDATQAVNLVAATAPLVCDSVDGRRAFVERLQASPGVQTVLLIDDELRPITPPPPGSPPFWAPEEVSRLRRMMEEGKPAYRYPEGTREAPLWVLVPTLGAAPGADKQPVAEDRAGRRVAAIAILFVGGGPLAAILVTEQLLLLFLVPIVVFITLFLWVALTRLVVAPVRRLIRTVDHVADFNRRYPGDDVSFSRAFWCGNLCLGSR